MTVPSASLAAGALAAHDHRGPETPRLVLDAGYLNGLLPPGGACPDLSAEAWEQALLYAGLLHLLRGGAGDAPPDLARRLSALNDALDRLRAADAEGPALSEWTGALPALGDGVLAGLAGAGLLALVLGAPLGAGAGLVGVLLILGLRRLAGWVRVGAATGSRQAAQAEVARCVRAFLEHTWVEPVGRQLVESAPTQELLRRQLSALDRTLGRARSRMVELEGLAEDLRSANLGLGQAGEDAETRRLAAQRAALGKQIASVELLRGRFAEQQAACEAALERLRALARRRLLSHRVSAAKAVHHGTSSG